MLESKKYLVVVFVFLFCSSIYSQSLTQSPYSRYGIGTIIENSIAQSMAMGGLEQAQRYSSWINYSNPASYSALELTTFQTGIKISETEQSTADIKQKVRNGYMTAFAIGIPLKRNWGLSFGLVPYSSVGYKVSNTNVAANGEEVNYLYKGSGGLNKVYLGTAINPFSFKSDSSWLKGFSIGVNASYLFGTLNYERRAIFTNSSTNYYFNFRETNVFKISDFYLEYGLQYKTKLTKKWLLVAGVSLTPLSKIKGNHSGLAENYIVVNGLEYPKDTVSNFNNEKGNITLPPRLGFGAIAHYSDKVAVGFDLKTQDWTKYTSFGVKDSLQRSTSVSLGVQFIPNPSNGRGFWQHVQYRVGVNYTSSYVKIRNTQLTEKSVSIGAGFPIIKSLSTLNIALQYGTRGTIENNLVLENFYALNLGLTFSDKWFIKRKFD